ncbi:lipid droplet-associated protein [Mycobacterium sp. 94-17]|uniref:lipid droplet-associated protein n=1 Tax=Mycobacterium sp. 94-17 TaxID=2986147 RepID=UPI002D1EA1E8|nr:lipid droplet-associated protein [Mycobacterium sp. 94-17]MEB4212005.1 lipid droplet-associated protein [Mycobacterium sp. 94-17]
MGTAPYGVRLLVGAATVAVEETIRLPKSILMYPMTLASQAAHIVMRFQQNLAELAIKGDSTLESIFPPKDEKPEWATFDEDLDDAIDGGSGAAHNGGEGERRAEGRFALYSVADAHEDAGALTNHARQSKDPAAKASAPQPAVVAELDYTSLTLAQLRARLQSLSVDELEALLAYEQATKGRAPFETLLANRITRANAK